MGLLQRQLEENGFYTVGLSNLPGATKRVLPPRTLIVPGPRGQTAGPPHDVGEQRRRVAAALDLISNGREPGMIVQLPSDNA